MGQSVPSPVRGDGDHRRWTGTSRSPVGARSSTPMTSPPDQELAELRREVDRVDGDMVDLLVERLRIVRAIAGIKRRVAEAGPAIRPGREAAILRRLVERSGRRFPAGTLVRMWRELLAATTREQAPLAVAACVPPDRPELWDLARDHFGSTAPIQRTASGSQAVRLLADGAADLAVMPLPAEDEPWWVGLLDTSVRPLRVVARLPFGPTDPRLESCGALVVGAIEPEASGDDLTLLAMETPPQVGRGRLLDLLAGAGLMPRWLATRRQGEMELAIHLIELDGFLAPGDQRLADALAAGREHVLRSLWLGGYARPLADED